MQIESRNSGVQRDRDFFDSMSVSPTIQKAHAVSQKILKKVYEPGFAKQIIQDFFRIRKVP